jgi:hypothetical protein
MLLNFCEQNTDEWLHDRLGVITASEFKNLLTAKTLKPSASATQYLAKLAAEQITGDGDTGWTGNAHTQRGHDREPRAIADFEFITDLECFDIGMVYMDETKRVACSPDALVNDNGVIVGLECKCLLQGKHAFHLLNNELPAEHYAQVQSSIFIARVPHWYFCSYHPKMKMLIVKCYPDNRYQNLLNDMIPQFLNEIDFIKTIIE